MPTREELESKLNDFSGAVRREALAALADLAARDSLYAPARDCVNLHCHTFYSYNGYGYSPETFAWKARCHGLKVGGVVDFDVLDAADEFLDACRLLGLRGCAGIETRVFVPEFSSREINSPGEPGIAYFMGVGFPEGAVARSTNPLLAEMKQIANGRTRDIASRVNAHLEPASVDFERDVIPLTPKANTTERHLCAAYDNKARQLYRDPEQRAAFWAEKLGMDAGKIATIMDDAPALQGLIRSKTMKAGGVGYVTPSGPDFPALERVSRFILESGAIPTHAWLDGTTEGEASIEELLDVSVAAGAAAVNIIPDRNWNIKDPQTKELKVRKLLEFVEIARARHMPIVVGTEMNAFGQPFVDDFDAPELAPLTPLFMEGAHIVYAHTWLQSRNMGYLSPWASAHFASTAEKNAFFAEFGRRLDPARTATPLPVVPGMTRDEVLGAAAE